MSKNGPSNKEINKQIYEQEEMEMEKKPKGKKNGWGKQK